MENTQQIVLQNLQKTSDELGVSGGIKFKYDINASYDKHKNLHGKLIYVSSAKINIYECDYIHGIKQGKEIFRFKNGKIREISNFKKNVLSGKKECFDWMGFLIKEEQYRNGFLHGVSKIFEHGKLKTETNYKYGKKNGKEIVENWGKYDQYNFKDDLKHGLQHTSSFLGEKYTEKFNCGKRNGTQLAFLDNGLLLSKENFLNGVRDGKQYLYYENKALSSIANFKKGVLSGKQVSYFINGLISTKELFIDSKRHGTQLTFYKNGNLKTKSNYISDKKFGLCEGYYENGIKAYSLFYKNNDPVGPNKWWENDGTLINTKNKSFLDVTNNIKYISAFPSESFTFNWYRSLKYKFEGEGEYSF